MVRGHLCDLCLLPYPFNLETGSVADGARSLESAMPGLLNLPISKCANRLLEPACLVYQQVHDNDSPNRRTPFPTSHLFSNRNSPQQTLSPPTAPRRTSPRPDNPRLPIPLFGRDQSSRTWNLLLWFCFVGERRCVCRCRQAMFSLLLPPLSKASLTPLPTPPFATYPQVPSAPPRFLIALPMPRPTHHVPLHRTHTDHLGASLLRGIIANPHRYDSHLDIALMPFIRGFSAAVGGSWVSSKR